MGDQLISKFKVRDYECDMQGIVNNANYFHYLEHSRHEFLNENNIDFKKAHDEGFDLVVSNMEAKFIKPLKPRDIFEVRLRFSKEGRLRYIFEQEIWKISNDLDSESEEVLVLKAKITCACVDLKRGRPSNYVLLDAILV
ncbi:MAG: acyl-CoA thioesterase [Candidatus Caenarcaniphilales bacterium]|nr:acyl-CoA thioesterase [Candidatus Caenarcaniphilales bacterium]